MDGEGTTRLKEIKSYYAEVIVIPTDFNDFSASSLLSTLVRRANSKLKKIKHK